MEFYSTLKRSKTYLFTTSKSKRDMMTMTVRRNAALWLALLGLAMSIRWGGPKPGERQPNSIKFYSSPYLRHQNEILPNEFGSTLSSHSYPEYFRIQDLGKFVKCDVISLASITKIKMAAHCPKMASFWPVLRSSFSKTIHLWTNQIAQPQTCRDGLLLR